MRSRIAVAAMVLAAAAGLSGCDSAPPVQTGARQVTVIGNGQVQGTPDTLTADVSIEAVAPDVTAAMNQTNERQQAVINSLTGGGIDAKDIATSGVSLQPQYGDNSVITGYRAVNSIRVTIRKLDSASSALAGIVGAGGNNTRINSVSYSIEDDSNLVNDARSRAFDDARNRAQQYAKLSGLSLGKVISISESPSGTTPVPQPMPGAMAAAVPLQPGQQTVGFAVTVIWELN